MTRPLLRFAPSPNGFLHLGHAYSALLNERIARDLGGTWLLRIEDIDPVRATPDRIAAVAQDLAWLGLSWPHPVRHQSRHMAEYGRAAASLRGQGLLYPCFCSRSDVAAAVAAREPEGRAWLRDPDGIPLYPGTCRALSQPEVERRVAAGEPHAWRLDVEAALRGETDIGWTRFDPDGGRESRVAADPGRWGDVVLVRREVATSYHLSVVVDDAAQGITHVVRGTDLAAATDIHALLARRLGLALPRYHHHALLTGPDGLKLAKSRDSHSLRAMRRAGADPHAIRAELGFALACGFDPLDG